MTENRYKRFHNNPKSKYILLGIIAVILIILVVSYLPKIGDKPSETDTGTADEAQCLKVEILDVGQGDAIYIKTPDGHNVLIDAGTYDYADNMTAYLKNDGVENVDAFIITHAHSDHYGGAKNVFKTFNVLKTALPTVGSDASGYNTVLDRTEKEKCEKMTLEPGTSFSYGECKFTVLGPNFTYENMNNNSYVLRLDYKNTSFMLTGDMGNDAERESMEKFGREIFDCDVLKVGHHGSYDATSDAFLSAVSPKIAVISCGKDNEYGHPHRETMEKLSAAKIETYITSENGTVTVYSDGENVFVK